MADPTTDYRRRVWLYREPWRSGFLVLLLANFGWDARELVRRVPDQYPHQHASLVLVAFGLVAFHLGAAYAPPRWQLWASRFSLAFAFGLLLTQLLP